MSAVYGE